MGTKRAKITAMGVEIACPHCGEGITHPETGSYLWATNEVWPNAIDCTSCGKLIRLNPRPRSAQML